MKEGARGYTLFELLFVAAIAAVVMAVTVPLLTAFSARLAANTAIAQAMQAALLSRQRAVATHEAVVWCADDGHGRCASDWFRREYWLFFADKGRDGRFDSGDVLISRLHFDGAAGWLVWKGFARGSALMWLPSGYGSYQNGTLTYCPDRADPALLRQLVLSRTGRVRQQVLGPQQRRAVWAALCRAQA